MEKLYTILMTIACVTIIIVLAIIVCTSIQESWQHVEEIAATVATTVATTIATTILERLNKIVPDNTPKSEQISFNNTPVYTPYSVTKIANMLHRNSKTINPVLARKGIITKTNNGWVLNKKYEEAGYGKTFEGGQFGGTYVKYSEKGMQEIVKIFK